jgi:hypothetical protein
MFSHQLERASSECSRPPNERLGANRDCHIERSPDFRAEELGRCDSDNRVAHPLHHQRVADDIGASAEAPLPEAVADDGNRTVRPAAASIVVWRECAPQNCRGAEDLEEPTARPHAVDQFRLNACGEVESGRRPRCRAVKRLLAIPDCLPDGVGPRASIDRDEPLGLFHGQRAKDQAVEDREDCGVCPDPKRQRKNGDNRHNRCSDEGTAGVTQVCIATSDGGTRRRVGSS